jgi:hypothetical protein
MASFNLTDTIQDTQKNFFYVMFNGLRELRAGSEKIAERFYNFYTDEIKKYQTTFLVIMSMAMFCLVVSQIVLIPIVFQVHKTNNRVMSLFGIIPISEIRELASKCEKYMQRFLEDKSEKKDDGTTDEKKNVEPANPAEVPPEEEIDAKSNNNVC